MPVVPPSPAFQTLFDRFDEAGGVVEVIVHEGVGAAASPEAHEVVARQAASQYGARTPRAIDRTTPLTGRRVGLLEMMGDRFDPDAHRLLFSSHLGLLPGAETDAARKERRAYGSSILDGLGRAFSSPPYSIRLPCAEIDAIFQTMWSELVGTWDEEDLVVMSWDTIGWDAFAAGRDWWGSFLWTVARRSTDRFVSFAASATD